MSSWKVPIPPACAGTRCITRTARGGISYARFAHLGKEGVLGRYAIHFHLVGDTMRGSQVLGVAIVDSSNRWVTIHGTEYLIVRDCVGYRSAGHGFFLEDATEIYNLLDRNLAVQAYRTKPLPKQALPFDQNDGAGFWWANGRNTFVRNVTSENDEYGYRYDMQNSKYSQQHAPHHHARWHDQAGGCPHDSPTGASTTTSPTATRAREWSSPATAATGSRIRRSAIKRCSIRSTRSIGPPPTRVTRTSSGI